MASIHHLTLPYPLEINRDYGKPYVTGTFEVGGKLFLVVFNKIATATEARAKGYGINMPDIPFPSNGMVEIFFDALSVPEEYGQFRHVPLPGENGSRVLFNVAKLVRLHYSVCKPGGYLFYAAPNVHSERKVDLVVIYNSLLGLRNPQRAQSHTRLCRLPAGWHAYNGLCADGRGYVITC